MKNISAIGTALSLASLSVVGFRVGKFQNIALVTEILSENSVREVLTFQCQGGKSFTGSFTVEQAIVTLAGEKFTLPRVSSGSGAKYSDGATTVWTKGEEALIEVNEETILNNCRIFKRAASAESNNLQVYDEPNADLTTRYPENMEVEGNYCSSEGCGYSFTFKPQNNALDNAEVQIFLPSGVTTTTEIETFVTGENGLLANNNWTIVEGATPPQDLMYPWVKKIIPFSDASAMRGYILLGKTTGQAVRVTLLYPTKMSDAYWSSVKPVLDNLQFKSN